MTLEAHRFKSKEWNCTRKELVIEIRQYKKESDLKTEKEVRHFLDLKFHLVKGSQHDIHVSQVMTILGLLSFDKKKDPPAKVKTITKEEASEIGDIVYGYDKRDDSRMAAFSLATSLKKDFKFYTPSGDHSPCWVYQDQKGIWVDLGRELIESIVTRSLGQSFSSRILNEAVKIVRYSTRDEDVTLGGMAPNKMVMANGVFDTDSYKFSPDFNPDDYQLTALPYEYDAKAECPRFRLYLEEVCPNEEDQQALVEFMGYCLIHHHRIHTFIVLVGQGENGKDRFCGTLTTMLGDENVTGMTLQQLAHNRFMAARLRDKLANICPDITDAPIKVTGIVKALTGESPIEMEKKHQEGFTHKSSTKLFFSANQIPVVSDMTDAWFRRVRIIEFPNQFKVDNPKRDENLQEKLDGEIQGVFNLAMEGWKRLKKQGHLTGSKSTEETRLDYLKRSNPLQYFVYKFCKPDQEMAITVDAAFECYKHVALKMTDKPPITKNWFSTRLLEMMEHVESRQYKIEGKARRTYVGMRVDLELLGEELGPTIDSIRVHQYEHLGTCIMMLTNALNDGTDPDQQKLDSGYTDQRIKAKTEPAQKKKKESKKKEKPMPEESISMGEFVEDEPEPEPPKKKSKKVKPKKKVKTTKKRGTPALTPDVMIVLLEEKNRTHCELRDLVVEYGYSREEFEKVFKKLKTDTRLKSRNKTPVYYSWKEKK